MRSATTGKQLKTCAALVSNIVISVVIVLLNKWIYAGYGFPNMTLTCIHFLITSLGMETARRFDIFYYKSLPFLDMLMVSLSFCGFVVLTNFSLQMNTVGTYQISKFLTTPCIMLLQTLFYHQAFSCNIILTIIPICLGVFLNNYNDIQLNFLGLVYAVSGVLVTSVYQVLIGAKQHEFQANSMQLLYYQAPLSALLLMIAIPFCEPVLSPGGIFGTTWSSLAMVAVLASGLVAFLVNLSIFWVIGNTSPLTYNMAGHLKFCLVATGGFFIFHELPTLTQVLGIMLTISGVMSYTYLKLKTSRKENVKPTLSA